MRTLRFVLFFFFLLLLASVLSCGTTHGQLKSISISPATATGQAQFRATGTYADGHTVTPLEVLWSEGNPWLMSDSEPQGIAVSTTGMASCNPVVGRFAVQATAPVNPYVTVAQMDMMTPQVHGTAYLSCP